MNIKKCTLTVLSVLAFSFPVFSQNSTPVSGYADEYTYDGTGNRIKRHYLITVIAPKNNSHEEQPVDTLKEQGLLIKAYPNPVADEMIVENLSWKERSSATVKISDITGRLLHEKTFYTAKEVFSLSSFIPGTYTVSYYLNGHLYTTWKIIKK